jgi:hypothetical protein
LVALDRFGDQYCGKAFRLPRLQPGWTDAAVQKPHPDQGAAATTINPLSTATALGFRQGRSVLPQVEAVLAALVWDGWISQAKGNANFVLRTAA